MNIREHLTTKHGPASREPIQPRYLVLHDTEGSMPGDLYWLADAPATKDGQPHARVSVHYYVTRDGTVYQICRDEWSAWHAGRTYWPDRAPGVAPATTGNLDMHGIELEHRRDQDYPARQLRALDELVALLYERHHYQGTLSHREIAYPRGRKQDPELDVHEYSIAKVRARLGQGGEDDMTEQQEETLKFAAMWSLEAKTDALIARLLAEGDAAGAAKIKAERAGAVKYWRDRWEVR